MKLHAFVAMPFGTQCEADGKLLNFTRIYIELIKPGLERAGLEVIRADEERGAGDIREDMFQELLMADLVLADLTIDNPNVWYELGVRHALRARGVVIVQGPRNTKPFDIYTDRKLTYHLKDGAPDPEHLAADIQAITDMTRSTLNAWHKKVVSPVYSLLPNLIEPDWKVLRIGAATAFWARYDDWATRIELARKAGHPEDILVLADEAPVTALRVEARLKAGKALLKCRHHHFALEQFESACTFDPGNVEANRSRGICLQRLSREDDARAAYQTILIESPKDTETWALLGRLDKDAWVKAWNRADSSPVQMRDDASYEDAFLLKSIDSYVSAFIITPGHYYSGINALTLIHLYHDLTGQRTPYDNQINAMANGISWAATCERDPSQLYWAKATLGDLLVLDGTPATVSAAYKTAIAVADNDWFALNSTLTQLKLLAALGFRPDNVLSGIATFERALARLSPPEREWQPKKVFLFSGHMIDRSNGSSIRFPADKESIAANAIALSLDKLGACESDLAFTQGAAGGDILFAEAAIARNMRVQLQIPFLEPEFIERSVLPVAGGENWRKRYYQLRDHPLCLPLRVMPSCLGPLPKDGQGRETNPYERCNQWLLNSALARGISRTRFICLWNGGGGHGPGGTEHMMREVRKRTGQVTWIDTRQLW